MPFPRLLIRLALGAVLLTGVVVAPPDASSPFIVEPYLQLGDVPKLSPSEPVRVLWQLDRIILTKRSRLVGQEGSHQHVP